MSGRAYYNEHDPKAAAWLRELIAEGLIADGDVDERSIRDVRGSDLAGYVQCHFFAGIGVWSYALRLAGWPDDRPVWTGSCPCQPFSAAGKKQGEADDRHLWPEFFRLIRERRPVKILGEQVASKDGLAWIDAVLADLEGADYAAGAVDLCAAGVGAPHIRQRLWIVGERVDDAAGPRHARSVEGPEGIARHEARVRLPGEGSGLDGLADAYDARSQGRRQSERERAGERIARPDGLASGMGNASLDGERAFDRQSGEGDGPEKPLGGPGFSNRARPGPVNGLWRDADWLFCRDGKFRPVEPGTFPLAHGIAGRVGLLRGYGNAIVAPVAQAFIEAVMRESI